MVESNEVEINMDQGTQAPEGFWTEHENIDMCRQGDVQLVMDWRSKSSIDEMKRDVERLGYSSITVSNGHPTFPFAALKKFDFQLTPEHCKPISSCCKHPCKIYIWHPKVPPSHWRTARSPSRDAGLNGELNSTARNTDDADKLRHLVRDRNADLLSTNGAPWHHTPLHQAAYHGREQCARALLELLEEQGVLERCLEMASNPCGRPGSGKPIELARGGGHAGVARLLEEAASGCSAGGSLDGHYFSFKIGGDPADVVDRFEARQSGNRVTFYRNGPVGTRTRVDSATARAMESYSVDGSRLQGAVGATIKPDGDLEWSHGYVSRREPSSRGSPGAPTGVVHLKPGQRLSYADSEAYARRMGGRLLTLDEARAEMRGGALYPGEDQWCAVQGRDWVQVGDRPHHAGKSHVKECGGYPPWGDDPGNQKYGNPTWNSVVLYMKEGAEEPGRGESQRPPKRLPPLAAALGSPERSPSVTGRIGHWTEHTDIDMCSQGDVMILPNWRATTTIEVLKQMVEDKGYSAITVSNGNPSFGHAALKKFDYQLTTQHCKPISTCCRHPCKIYIWTPGVNATASGAAPAVVVAAPAQAAPMASLSTGSAAVPVVVGVPVQSAMGNYGSPDYGRSLVQATPVPSAPASTDEPFPGYIPAHDLQGCWACACVPFGCACFRKEAQGPDSLLHHGCVFLCCVMPCHFREMRHRVPGMNGFHKEGESQDQNVDHYYGRRCVCNGPSCSLRLC